MNISPIDFNYVDGLNNYPILDYIDEKTSNNNIYLTSNITSNIINNNINITSNIILNRYDKLIKEETESRLLPIPNTYLNTYIYNSNVLGEIRFWCKSTNDFIVVNPIGVPDYRVKIDVDGKLKVYYTFDPVINLTFGNGWIDVGNSIVGLNASDANINLTMAGLEAQITTDFTFLDGKIDAVVAAMWGHEIINDNQFENITQSIDQYRTNAFVEYNSIPQLFNNIKNIFTTGRIAYVNRVLQHIAYIISTNPTTSFFLGAGGVGIGFAISFIQNQNYINTINARINEKINSNIIISQTKKNELITSNYINSVDEYINLCYNYSNLTVSQGFLNSNITTQQYINNLKCNTITLNNKAITKFSLDNLDDWIKTPNGIYYDITNGTIAINSTPTAIDFFRVGGQTTIQGDFICEKKLIISNTSIGSPTASTNGGIGDKLILRTGGTGLYPYSLGVNTNNMWYSAPTGVSHNFYINGSPITAISSSGLSTIGTINASTNLQENAVNLSSKYLQLSGGIMSGDLSFNNRVQDFLIYLFSTNYGFGVNSLALRYNVPFDASHKFYSGPTNTATISSTGAITASAFVGNGASLTNIPFSAITSVPSYVLKAGDTITGQLSLSSTSYITPLYITSTATASTNAIQIKNNTTSTAYIGVAGTTYGGNYQNNLFIQSPTSLILNTGGNGTSATPNFIINSIGDVGIGTTDPLNKLYLSWGSSGKPLVQFTQTTAWDNANPALSVSGYTNLGGFRINGADANASLYQINANADISFLQNAGNTTGGNIKFSVIGAGGNIIFNSSSTERMRIKSDGNVGIATNNPNNILQVGDGGKLRISNGVSDYTLIGTKDVDDNTNTRIVISGNTRASPYSGNIEYISTSGAHAFYTSAVNQRMIILNNGNIGIGNNDPFYPLCIGTPSSASDGVLVISKNTGAGANRNFKFGYDANYYFTMGDFGNANNTTNTWKKNLTIDYGAMSIGMGTTPKVASSLTIYDDTQIKARIILSGQEYYRAGFTSGDGLALFCGVNRDSNKQLWIGNSANLAQNAAKAFVRISAENEGYIDVTNGDGTGAKPFTIGGSSITLNTDTTINGTTTQNGDINVNNGNIVLSNEGKAVYTPTLVCGGNTLYYVVNWNGTNHSGWFYDLNQHFYSGHAYLTIAIHAMNVAGSYAYCWFGRALLSTFPNGTPPATNGGVISLIADYRNPASYAPNNNYISVVEVLDTSGHSALKISISNAVFGAQFKIKVVG